MSSRVFIAVNLPEEVKRRIYERLSSRIPAEQCKVVKADNLHITMLFLGYLETEKIEEIKKKLAELDFGKFDVVFSGIGEFNGRVVWLGVKEGSNELRAINRRLNEMLELRDERFHPHVTLARNKRLGRKEVRELVERLNSEKYETRVKVESIDIMRSVLKKTGSEYSVLFRSPLS